MGWSSHNQGPCLFLSFPSSPLPCSLSLPLPGLQRPGSRRAPCTPNLELHGKPDSTTPQNSLPLGLRHTAFRPRQLADGVPPCALALGKLEVADLRGIRLQRKKGWWKGVGTEDGPGGQAKLRVCAGHCYSGGGEGVQVAGLRANTKA